MILSVVLKMGLGKRVFVGVLAFIALFASLLFIGMSHMFGGGWNGESFGYGGFVFGALGIVLFVILGGGSRR